MIKSKLAKLFPATFLLMISIYSFLGLFYSNDFEFIELASTARSLLQTFLSSFFVFVFGIVGGLCLFSVSKKYRGIVLALILLPQFLPSNLFMSSILSFFDFIQIEFKGLSAVVFTHIILNTGLSSCLLYLVFQKKLISLIDVYSVYKLSKKEFLYAVLKSGLMSQVVSIFLFFVLVHSLSFSIPLILTEEIVSFEHLLYDSLSRGSGLLVGLFVICFYFILSRLNISSNTATMTYISDSKKIESNLITKLCLLLYLFPVFLSLMFLIQTLFSVGNIDIDTSLFIRGLKGQFLILSIGSLMFFINLISGLIINLNKSRIYYLFIPSVSLLLFSGFLLSSLVPEVFVIGIGSYLSFFIFINIFLSSSFSNFHSAFEVFEIYKIKDKLSFFLKTEKKNVLLSFSFMSIWMGGDYVFSGLLSKGFVSFGSLSKRALISYQISESQFYSLFSLLFSLIFILLFSMVVYGKDFRFLSK